MPLLKFKNTLGEILRLAFPIYLGNLGQMLINIGDIYVAGHYSTEALAAISVASAIFMSFIIAAFGFTSAITPILSNYRGEKKPVKRYFLPTVLFSLFISLIFYFVIIFSIPLIYKIGLNESILKDTVEYIKISAYSVFGMILFTSLKEFLQAQEIVKLPNALLLFSVVFNIILNFVFVYGIGPIPEFGTIGIAIASFITRSALGFILFLFCIKKVLPVTIKATKKYIKEIFKIGTPIAWAVFIEFFGFNIVAVLVGRFEPIYAACHNIIISIVSAVFMVPFSISGALSVKVGYANGQKNIKAIKKYILTSILFILLYSFVISAIYVLFKENLISLFTKDNDVINLGVSVMIMAACFTTFDSIQSVCMGALRGIKRTFEVMVVDIIGFLLISTPLGLFLAYKFNLVLKGFWLGLSFGIFSAAIVSALILINNYFKLKKKFQIS